MWSKSERHSAWLAPTYAGLLAIVLGLYFGDRYIPVNQAHPDSVTRVDLWNAALAWDGQWYRRIATSGYTYAPEHQSPTVFFPLYPLIAGGISQVLGMRVEVVLVIVANLCFAACMFILGDYLRRRNGVTEQQASYVLALLALFPLSLFFRAGYSESLFLLLVLAVFWCMQRSVNVVIIACLIGLATACRPVGVALIPALLWHIFAKADEDGSTAGHQGVFSRHWKRGLIALGVLPISISGLLAYMAYLQVRFGEPFAFVKAQSQWTMREPDSVPQWIWSLLTLGPVRDAFDANCPCYWNTVVPEPMPIFNAGVLNPLIFCLFVIVLAMGAWNRWLRIEEVLYGSGVLLIPYVTQGYRICMVSQGRYALLAFPVFIVAGILLARCPNFIANQVLVVMGAMMVIYTALFSTWHWLY